MHPLAPRRACARCRSVKIKSFVKIPCEHDICYECVDELAWLKDGLLHIMCPKCHMVCLWNMSDGRWRYAQEVPTDVRCCACV